jgi:hypothetical protein
MIEVLEGEEEQASRLIDERDNHLENLNLAIALQDQMIKELERDNRRLQIYRKAIHEICGYRMASPTGYIMLAKQVVDWYEELDDETMENKLHDDYRLMKRSWINAL